MRETDHPQEARVSQAEASTLYDQLAKHYDTWAALTESRARKLSLKLAAIKDGQHVLEVAVGTGLTFLQVVKRNPRGRNVAIDISQGMLAKAKVRLADGGCTNFELSSGSAFDIQEEADSFDVVLNSYMLDLIDQRDWPTIIGEFHRVLKPRGRLVLVNMTRGERFGSGLYEKLYAHSPKAHGWLSWRATGPSPGGERVCREVSPVRSAAVLPIGGDPRATERRPLRRAGEVALMDPAPGASRTG